LRLPKILVRKLIAMGDTSQVLFKSQRTARKSCLKVDSKVRAHSAQVNVSF